jgi:hypothetical protein
MATLENNQVRALIGLGADAMDNMFDIMIDPPQGLTTLENIGAGRPGALGAAAYSGTITLRADGFEPPAFNPKLYKIGYKAVTIERPSTKIEGDRQFKITFRLDANYQAYRFLSAWKSIVMQASTGYVTNALWAGGLYPGTDAGDTSGIPVSELNRVFGMVRVSALARPIYQSTQYPYSAQGVTIGKFTNDIIAESHAGNTIPSSIDMTTWNFYQVWLSNLEEPKYKTDGGDIIKVAATFKFGEFKDPIYDQYGPA